MLFHIFRRNSMRNISASPEVITADEDRKFSADQKKSLEIQGLVSKPTVKSYTARGKDPYISDEASNVSVEKVRAELDADVGIKLLSKPYKKLGDNLFVAECYSPAGEKMYVGMELIEVKTLKSARLYACGTRSMVREVAGVFVRALGGDVPPEETEKYLTILGIHNRDNVRELTEKPRKSKFSISKNRGAEIMGALYGGTEGFSPSASGKHYFVYASSKPIPETGLLASLPDKFNGEDYDELLGFFKENYSHLIMSVISRLDDDGESLENRGILRNPISILEGSFKEIAMPAIHGFSALVAANEFGRSQIFVRAMGEMHNNLKSALPASELISPADEHTTYLQDNYLLAKLGTLQNKFIATLSPKIPSTNPVVIVREKKDSQ
jgi:hypothetical protein